MVTHRTWIGFLVALVAFAASSVPLPSRAADGDDLLRRPLDFSVLFRTDHLDLPRRGRVFVGTGIEVRPDWRQPFSGFEGTLVRYGVFAVQVAFTDAISVRVDGSLVERLDLDRAGSQPRPGFSTTNNPKDAGVPRVATLIRVLRQRGNRPAFGLSFAATVPTTDDTEGIGLDTTDVFGGTIWSWYRPLFTLTGNVGVGILTSPTELNEQNDVLTWGVKAVRDVGRQLVLMGEVTGHTNTRNTVFLGTEDRSVLRVGAAWTARRARLEVALMQGLTRRDGDLGFGFGVTWGSWRRENSGSRSR